jgi:transposase
MPTKKEPYFIGMDLHQKTSTLSVKEKEGRVIEAKTISTTKEDIEAFLSPYRGSTLTLEPVSQWYCYADYIESLGLAVKIANPMRVKAIASARIKTDSIDAGVLADLLRADMLPESYHAPADVRAWKEEVRLRMSLVRLRVQVKNKIHALLWKQGLCSPYTLFSKKGLSWLDQQTFSKEPGIALATYRETLALLDRQIAEAEMRMIADNKHREEVRLLITIPGISYLSALTIMAEVGDIARFPSAKKLMGYAGVVPSTYASGAARKDHQAGIVMVALRAHRSGAPPASLHEAQRIGRLLQRHQREERRQSRRSCHGTETVCRDLPGLDGQASVHESEGVGQSEGAPS